MKGRYFFGRSLHRERREPALFLCGGFGGRNLFQFGKQRTRCLAGVSAAAANLTGKLCLC